MTIVIYIYGIIYRELQIENYIYIESYFCMQIYIYINIDGIIYTHRNIYIYTQYIYGNIQRELQIENYIYIIICIYIYIHIISLFPPDPAEFPLPGETTRDEDKIRRWAALTRCGNPQHLLKSPLLNVIGRYGYGSIPMKIQFLGG